MALILAAFDLGSLYGKTLGISMETLVSRDTNWRNPLHFATANNAISSIYWIKAVCTNGRMLSNDMSAQTDANFQTPFHLAAQRGHKNIVELLLDRTNSKFPFDGRVFEMLASSGYIGLFGDLYNKTEIQISYQLIHILNQAAKLDSPDLMERISFDFQSRVDKGLASLADLTDNRITLLHAALTMQSTTVIDFLLKNEDFHNARDRKSWTALHVAADEGNEPVAVRLIEKGIWIHPLNSQGDAALHIATHKGFAGVVRLLCEKGAKLKLDNSLGQLPAHLAAETGAKDILKMLCDRGTNLRAMEIEGRTPLRVASKAGQAQSTFCWPRGLK